MIFIACISSNLQYDMVRGLTVVWCVIRVWRQQWFVLWYSMQASLRHIHKQRSWWSNTVWIEFGRCWGWCWLFACRADLRPKYAYIEYTSLHTYIHTFIHIYMLTTAASSREGLQLHVEASMISGFITTVVSMPVDIVKTRCVLAHSVFIFVYIFESCSCSCRCFLSTFYICPCLHLDLFITPHYVSNAHILSKLVHF